MTVPAFRNLPCTSYISKQSSPLLCCHSSRSSPVGRQNVHQTLFSFPLATTYKSGDLDKVWVHLSARSTLHLEVIVEWILWSIIWTKVRDTICMLARELVFQFPSFPYFSISAVMVRNMLTVFNCLNNRTKRVLLLVEADITPRG